MDTKEVMPETLRFAEWTSDRGYKYNSFMECWESNSGLDPDGLIDSEDLFERFKNE